MTTTDGSGDLQRGRTTPAARVYLDHAATTPPDPGVIEAMLPYLREQWHNPSSIYVEAQRTAQAIDEARATIARCVGADPDEIVFTSGGSESDSLALRGVLAASTRRGRHLVTTSVEHHAVLDTAEQLERDGVAELTIVDPGSDGRVDPAAVAAAVRDDTVLVSVMHANNEVGALNDIAEIARLVRARNPRTAVHTDAVQSAAHLGVHVDRLGVDLMTFTAHKLYGPRGAGALYVRAGTPLAGQILGGGQERRLRAGTENTPAIVGFAHAMALASDRREADLAHERALQARLVDELPRRVPMLALTGPRRLADRLPGNVSCAVAFVEGESILLALDLAGIAASSGSACTTGSVEPSHVLMGMGMPAELARGSLRFTLGRDNTDADVDRLLTVLPPIVERLRALSPVPTNDPPAEYRPWLDAETGRG
ncbi:MAG: cysteine desulfurase family protein [Chloroflexi bacterium]|nr:cysteine desulfurase family protein [Chloroflexota bacterium]MDA1004546.1 cysteine desulfurase family protein [Chloroflexota bacterium]